MLKKIVVPVCCLLLASTASWASSIISSQNHVKTVGAAWRSLNPQDKVTVYPGSAKFIEIDVSEFNSIDMLEKKNGRVQVTNCKNFRILEPKSFAVCSVDNPNSPIVLNAETYVGSSGFITIE